MKTITGVFDTGTAARTAIGMLHEAGVSEDDIAFLLSSDAEREPESVADASERTGARIGAFAADIGRTGASFIPFVGRNLVDSPMGRALRDATETAGAVTGRLFGAVSDGGFATSPQDAGATARASVTVRAAPDREMAVRSILAGAGALTIESE